MDIAPWSYAWRADRVIQEKPEAYFIPRRLERIDKVYRTAYYEMPEQDLKSIYYDMPDLLKPLPPQPKGKLQAGLIWIGGLVDYEVELQWMTDAQAIPSPDDVEVRVYPTSWGWFGWTVDKILVNPEISDDGLVWTYKCEPGAKMDLAYNVRVDAATEMVAVFYEDGKFGVTAIPNIRVIGQSIGVWERMDVEIEWGFQEETEKLDFDGWLEFHVAM